jgi:hypothetical protein
MRRKKSYIQLRNCIKRKYKSGGTINGKSPEEFLESNMNSVNNINTGIEVVGNIGAPILDAFLPGAGILVKGTSNILQLGVRAVDHFLNNDKRKRALEEIALRKKEAYTKAVKEKLQNTMGYV